MHLSILMRLLLLSLLLCVSCYQPAISSGSFKCDNLGDLCPDGQVCVSGICVKPGEEPDLSGGGPDGPVDMAGAPPDLRPDPCAAGWTEIAANSIYACRRAFTVTSGGDFADLCRASYHVCSATDELGPVSANSSARCNAAGGFYTTQIDIALRNIDTDKRDADGICAPQSGDMARALLGCGIESGLYRLNSNGCNQLKTTLRCASAPTGWSCTSAQNVSHTSAPGGVLCCANK